MKKIVLTLVFGFLFVTFSNAQDAVSKVKVTKVAYHNTDAYQCPMDCEKGKTYKEEGSCPVCKMDLKKVTNKEGKTACAGKKAKGCCAGKKSAKKASCGSKAKASCAGKAKAGCAGKK